MIDNGNISLLSRPMRIPAATFDLMDSADQVLSFAFQPIVDADQGVVRAYEALVRGRENQDAASVFESVPSHHMLPFDQQCRADAITMAMGLGLDCELNLNVDPRSFGRDGESMLANTVEVANRCGLPLDCLVLEITEGQMLENSITFRRLIDRYRSQGLKVAIDDFGSGYSGLNLLADFQPDQLKLDRHLARDIEGSGPRQAIVRALVQICGDLGIDLVAEGVEQAQTLAWFRREGVCLFQGFLFGRPGFEELPEVSFQVA